MSDSQYFNAVLRLPTCRLGVQDNPQGGLQQLVFLAPNTPTQAANSALSQHFSQALADWLKSPHQASFQLSDYLAHPTPIGTAFRQRVWQAIAAIPFGQVRYYGDLSHALHSSPRAIGQACGANPLPLIIPCHRVVAKHGLGGFANASQGWLTETKHWLLQHEQHATR